MMYHLLLTFLLAILALFSLIGIGFIFQLFIKSYEEKEKRKRNQEIDDL
jgi:hypothetical protein